MADHPFSNPAFAALGGQMAQMWQTTLETWWKALLGDGARLAELARRLSEAGHGSAGPEGAGAEDLARVLDALELMDGRLGRLEEQVKELAATLAAVVGYLEARPAPGQGGAASDGTGGQGSGGEGGTQGGA